MIVSTGTYFAWNPATEVLYSGDGEYEVYGYWFGPILQDHYLTFGEIDVSKAAVHRFTFRGFAPYEGPILSLHFNNVPRPVALTSDVCFRASLFRSGKKSPMYTRQRCLTEAASLYAESYIDRYGLTVFLGKDDLDISRLRRYELVVEVIGNDDRLSGKPAVLRYNSGWK